MPVVQANPRERQFQILLSKDMVRLVNRETGRLLHASAQGETDGTANSWLGYQRQAQVLKERAEARGEAWPYQMVHRTHFEERSKAA